MEITIKGKGHLNVRICDTIEQMGASAADFVTAKLGRTIAEKGFANLILATGTSQFTFLDALKQREVAWDKITVFHLDEYIGLPISHKASFRKYLKERILDGVAPKQVHLINGDAPYIQKEMDRYRQLLEAHPIDLACIGIGENGHIAFNDPHVADFQDDKLIKEVDLDYECRSQQFGEGWFPSLKEVPEKALTLTIPTIMGSETISCVVPDARKANAVFNTLNQSITEKHPATILRRHKDCTLFLDSSSAGKIRGMEAI
ncbi:MAG: glucosamine-6-phosphate deaminase [Bacteroidota bacterium]